MITSPDMFIAQARSTMETMQTMALKSLESFEKLATLNMQVTKTAFAESSDQIKAILAARDPNAFATVATAAAQPAADKVRTYAKSVYAIATDANTEIGKLLEKKFAEGATQMKTVLESVTKAA